MEKISLSVPITSIRNKKPSSPQVQPSVARPSSLFKKTRRFPSSSHEEFGFVG
jgi:hypothetical protein